MKNEKNIFHFLTGLFYSVSTLGQGLCLILLTSLLQCLLGMQSVFSEEFFD